MHAYEQWGFKDITKAKLDVLNKWAEFIYSPLMKDKVQKIQESDSGYMELRWPQKFIEN